VNKLDMELSEIASSETALVSVRLVTMDYYLSSPSTDTKNQFDPIYSMFRSAPIKKVPVLRVFGSTPGGQKTCLHIHGIFPYLYVPLPAHDQPGYLYRLAASLDKALNMTIYGSGSEQHPSSNVNGQHHVYKIVEVTGKPFYGYHSKEHRFAKIYLYNPYMLRKASDLLASGSVMGSILQPHYGHVPYTLQFCMDYNLQGMSLIHLKYARFRKPSNIQDRSQLRSTSSAMASDQLQLLISQPPSQRIFRIEHFPDELLAPDSLPPMSVCDLEIDAVACDIMNNNEDLMSTIATDDVKRSGNPGLEAIWQDEKLRRTAFGLDLNDQPLTPPSSPPRQRPANSVSDSEKFWIEQFHEAVENWKQKGYLDDNGSPNTDEALTSSIETLDSTANFDPNMVTKNVIYPGETTDESLLQAATLVENHLSSLSISNDDHSLNVTANQLEEATDEEISQKNSFFEDTIVDEAAMTELLNDSQSVANVICETPTLDSDDDELIELLQELKRENDVVDEQKSKLLPSSSRPLDSSQSSISSGSLVLSQFSQLQREKYDKEVNETLEMSELIWDEDPFIEENVSGQQLQDDFDNDSFWENYDFEPALN